MKALQLPPNLTAGDTFTWSLATYEVEEIVEEDPGLVVYLHVVDEEDEADDE
jgi:hypothetical protein